MENDFVRYTDIMKKIEADWHVRDKAYRLKRDTLQARLDALKVDPRRQPLSDQIASEAGWLIRYTEDWPRACAVLDKLEKSLATSEQGGIMQCADGSWGPGYTEWYRKLEPTFMELMKEEYRETIRPPLRKLTFMQCLKDWSYVSDYLDSVRVSYISETGRNNRDEFGAVMTALSMFSHNDDLKSALNANPSLCFKLTDEWQRSYAQYLKDLQNDATGCWGPSYRFHGQSRVVEAQDLSFTFHNVHFWPGFRAPRLPRIAETLLDENVENDYFPYGWQTNKAGWRRLSDHNNYDVIVPLHAAWPQLDPQLKGYAAQKLQALLHWCLTESVPRLLGQGDDPYNPLTPTTFYYAVRFLEDVGFWGFPPNDWCWPIDRLGNDPTQLACDLLAALPGDGSHEAEQVAEILQKYCPSGVTRA